MATANPVPPGTACQRVFAIFELREQILVEVGKKSPITLLRAQRVSHVFKSTIDNSSTLQRGIWRSPLRSSSGNDEEPPESSTSFEQDQLSVYTELLNLTQSPLASGSYETNPFLRARSFFQKDKTYNEYKRDKKDSDSGPPALRPYSGYMCLSRTKSSVYKAGTENWRNMFLFRGTDRLVISVYIEGIGETVYLAGTERMTVEMMEAKVRKLLESRPSWKPLCL